MSTSGDELLVRAAIVDELTAPLRVIEGELDKVAAAAKRLELSSGPTGATGGLRGLSGVTGELTKQAKAVHGTLKDVSGTLGRELTSAAKDALEGVGALAAGITFLGVKATSSFESARLGIQTFVGSAAKGSALFDQLRGLQGPFNIGQLTDAAQSMLTASGTADGLIPRMKALADIASTQADPSSALSSLADSLNKIQESGVVDARVLRPMLSAGVPVYELLSNELGIPVEQVKKTLASGAPLDLPVRFLADIQAEAGPLAKFKGALQNQRQTLLGQFQGIKVDATSALADVFSPLGDSLKTVTPLIRDGLVGLIKGVGPELITFLTALVAVVGGLLPIVRPIVGSILGALGSVLMALVPALNALAPHVPELATAFADLIVALIPAIPPLTQLTIALLPVLVIAIQDLTTGLTTLVRWLTPVVDWLTKTIDGSKTLRDILGLVLVGLLAYSSLSKVVGWIDGVVSAVWRLVTALRGLQTAQEAGGAVSAATSAVEGTAGSAAGGAASAGAAGLLADIALPVAVVAGGAVVDRYNGVGGALSVSAGSVGAGNKAAAETAQRAQADQWTRTGVAPGAGQGPQTYKPSAAAGPNTLSPADQAANDAYLKSVNDQWNASHGITVNGPLVAVTHANATPEQVAAAVTTAVNDKVREGRQR